MGSPRDAAGSEPPVYEAEVLLRPEETGLGFLPEGPYPCAGGHLSWVAIQHGASAVVGSLNVLELESRRNRSHPMAGRPGFAFPTTDPGLFLTGCEKKVGFYRPETGEWTGPEVSVEAEVGGTILNDGLIHGDAVVFGTKDLEFSAPKGGLYFWRPGKGVFTRLAAGQTCSNGKVILGEGRRVRLLDIDTPTRTVVAYALDLEAGTVGAPEVVLDLRHCDAYPDGMIATADGASVVIAFYDPGDPAAGEARQYGLATGAVEAVWRTAFSPRVTCPQWVAQGGAVRLVLTTAAEHMSEEQRRRHPNAGALFVAAAHGGGGVPPEPFALPPGL